MKIKYILLVVVAGALLLAFTFGVGDLTTRGKGSVDTVPDPGSSMASVALTVSTVRAQTATWPTTIVTSGSIGAWQEAVVSTEVGGIRLAQVLVDVGDQVQRDQLLAEFDDATVQADLERLQALVSEADANLAEAHANAARATRLRETSNISEQDLTSARTRAQTAQALLRSAQARVEMQQLVVHRTKVRAPDDGVISSRSAMLGAVPAVGAELFRLVRQNRLEWLAELTSSQLPHVAPGMQATLTLADGSSVTGHVRQIAPTLDSGTRTGFAYVDLGKTTKARAGMYASGTITLGESMGLTVPSSALVFRDGLEYVFVVTADHRAELAAVQTGRRRNDLVEIVSGITSNQDLVARGGTFLNDGDQVRVTSGGTSS